MAETLIPLLVLALVGALWLDTSRAREQATGLASRRCSEYGFQFLDGTAALTAVGLRWTRRGVRVRRSYRFDYTETGMGRHTGQLVLVGQVLEAFSFGIANGAVDEGSAHPPRGPRRTI